MKQVLVVKEELLTTLKANRAKHRIKFERGLEVYRSVVIAELEDKIAALRKGESIVRSVSIEAPEDHTADYDTVIQMLEMDVQGHIEIGVGAFQCYVQDQWHWMNQFDTQLEGVFARSDGSYVHP